MIGLRELRHMGLISLVLLGAFMLTQCATPSATRAPAPAVKTYEGEDAARPINEVDPHYTVADAMNLVHAALHWQHQAQVARVLVNRQNEELDNARDALDSADAWATWGPWAVGASALVGIVVGGLVAAQIKE